MIINQHNFLCKNEEKKKVVPIVNILKTCTYQIGLSVTLIFQQLIFS